MERYFNITGCCNPEEHYMVNLDGRLAEIKKMIDKGQYFCINRGRQYGKTTTILALEKYLANEYVVVSMDFQGLSTSEFATEGTFVKAFARELWLNQEARNFMSDDIQAEIKSIKSSVDFTMADLFACISEWCMESEKAIVLLIDEVDQASNNQVFLDFLTQLRLYYLKRNKRPTFQSVILASVHDIRNLRQKIRPDVEHRHNSPWNIASSFDVDMSFSPDDIAGMLKIYENDYHTGMDIAEISQLIYDYTSGYPVLVSAICKQNDENLENDIRWTGEGIVKAVGNIVSTRQMLFDSLINKLEDDAELRNCVHDILMNGNAFSYNPYDDSTDMALMYGFVKVNNGSVKIANRIFETVLYDFFLTSNELNGRTIVEGVV